MKYPAHLVGFSLVGWFCAACGAHTASPPVSPSSTATTSSHATQSLTSASPAPRSSPSSRPDTVTSALMAEPVQGVTTIVANVKGRTASPTTIRWAIDPATHAFSAKETITLPNGNHEVVQVVKVGATWWMQVSPPGTGWTIHTNGTPPNPAPALTLAATLKKWTRLRHAVVNAHGTTMYQTTLDAAGLRILSGGGATPLHVTAATLTEWVGPHGHVWKTRLNETTEVNGLTETLRTTTIYSNWGISVPIRPPTS